MKRKTLPPLAAFLAFALLSTGHATPYTYTTADGNGADTMIAFDQRFPNTTDDTNYGTYQFPGVKDLTGLLGTTTPPNAVWTQKAYVRFDTTGLAGTVTDASLDIDFLALGGSSGVINVFGLADGLAGETWAESTITYNNAPANDLTSGGGSYITPGTGGVVATDAAFLGTLTVGASDGHYTFSSTALVDFLNADTNHLVTFILTAATSGNNMQFYSKENAASATYPTLAVTAVPEPSTYALTLGGFAMLIGLRNIRRRRIGPDPKLSRR